MVFTPKVALQYGDRGVAALTRLLETLHVVHRWIAYELVTDLVVFVPLSDVDELLGAEHVDVPANQLHQFVRGVGVLTPLDADRYRIWTAVPDLSQLASAAVVYRFAGTEHFIIDGEPHIVPNLTNFPSIFGLPTFVDLEKALEYYSSHLARYSTCKILIDCWYSERRVVLANKPERFMRRSLAQYLKSTLRDHEVVEVREEQIVDESHPVDVKVTWSMPHRIALIEVKWMGDCVNEAGTALSTTRYRDARAREGAQQLAEYLDQNEPHAPTHPTIGYLAVFDARRRNVADLASDSSLSQDDATYYRDKPVVYDPQWHVLRRDFAEPSRLFLEPGPSTTSV